MAVFTSLLHLECPSEVELDASGTNPAFQIIFSADGDIPFPQVIIHGQGVEKLINGPSIRLKGEVAGEWAYAATVPAGLVGPGVVTIQVEGCRHKDLSQAGGSDWVKVYHRLELKASARKRSHSKRRGGDAKIYFGIHKHMHQPYYNTTDRLYWDGEKDSIFGSRAGNYTDFIPTAIRQYLDGGLPHAGMSTSWSGSLIEQLDRCANEGLCGGAFTHWNSGLREVAQAKTDLGNPRVSFSGFGFFHPLMPLIPARDIVRQIEWHRTIVREAFGTEASTVLFPPETAFHVRMIPALVEAGVKAVIYDSIHRYRACQYYPYAGVGEGMLPPNPAEQVNPPTDDWLKLHNIWAGSKIAPSLLRPEYVVYEDPDGERHQIIAIPAERYIGNEDARGGFGALQYPAVLGQVYDQIIGSGCYDAKHPPFFLLHSDGDNHGGGADSYYKDNTRRLVEWLQEDPRFELITVEDYLQKFPPDPSQTAHIEPGSWAGADNGDPQFMKWFSRYDQAYSPDLNSWAVLTAMQNVVHSLEDSAPGHPQLDEATRLLLTAETSCYWYWTGQEVWDSQVTRAANKAYEELGSAIKSVVEARQDRTGPTIFAPWTTPENPGGQKWGQGCLVNAPREATLHTFVYDVAGIKSVDLILRSAAGETRLPMEHKGPYPSQTGAAVTADYYTAELPVGSGDVRYFIEAEDALGNRSQSALERIYLA